MTVVAKPGFARMKRVQAACIIAIGLWAGACGDDPPTAPTTPTTPVFQISPIIGVLTIGNTQVYSVLNATADAVVTWSSTNSNVLTIDNEGLATALANGIVTITATTDSAQTATQQIQVTPNYQGTWTGRTTTTACTDIGGFATMRYCSQLGTAQNVTLTLTQASLAVSGTLTKAEGGGQLSGGVAGTINTLGEITLSGTLTGLSSGVNLSLALISWNSLATGSAMTGIWAANATSSQALGLATVQSSLTTVTLNSASAAPPVSLVRR